MQNPGTMQAKDPEELRAEPRLVSANKCDVAEPKNDLPDPGKDSKDTSTDLG